MSVQITEAMVEQFSANVLMLSQQRGTRLKMCVRSESQKGKAAFYDRIGAVDPVKKVGRHSNTPQIDTPHSRRMVTLEDYEWADLIDQQDKIRIIQEPTSEYVMAAMWSMGRAMDDEVILAATGIARAGESGATSIAFPLAQYYAANDGTNSANMSVETLRGLKQKFDAADVMEEEERYLAVGSSQIYSLLGDNNLTSSDYNSVKALVDGKVDTFMGFKFIRTERLPTVLIGEGLDADFSDGSVAAGTSDTTGFRKCIAWAKSGLLLSIGEDMKARITERDDKSYAVQPYVSMSVGAVRMEEVRVAVALCNEG